MREGKVYKREREREERIRRKRREGKVYKRERGERKEIEGSDEKVRKWE